MNDHQTMLCVSFLSGFISGAFVFWADLLSGGGAQMQHMVEIHKSVLSRLEAPPFCHQLKIIQVIDSGHDTLLLWVTSPAILTEHVQQELYFEGDKIKFKRWVDA